MALPTLNVSKTLKVGAKRFQSQGTFSCDLCNKHSLIEQYSEQKRMDTYFDTDYIAGLQNLIAQIYPVRLYKPLSHFNLWTIKQCISGLAKLPHKLKFGTIYLFARKKYVDLFDINFCQWIFPSKQLFLMTIWYQRNVYQKYCPLCPLHNQYF